MLLGETRDAPFSFAAPDESAPTSWGLADFNQERADREGDAVRRVVKAAERTQILVDNVNSRGASLEQAVDRRIAAVRAATGVTLENYLRQPSAIEQMVRDRFDPVTSSDLPETGRDAFHRKLRELAEAQPDHAARIQPELTIEDDARAAARGAEAELQAALADPNLGTVSRFGSALFGGVLGSFRDPLQVAALFAGGGASTAKTVIARIGQTAMREAAINAGTVAVMQPAVQTWRSDVGLRSGVVPAIENIGMAALVGGVIGPAVQGVRELRGSGRDAAEKVINGTARADDVATAAEAAGVKVSDADVATMRAAERADEAAGVNARPAAVPQEIHDDTIAQAIRHGESPSTEPPPDIPPLVAERPADQVRIIDEALPVSAGGRETVDGKPVTFERFDPATLTTDAAAFQFKGNADAAGVTERLRLVTQWDPTASGKTFVFERNDGTRVIADGHQRLGLAQRLLAQEDGARWFQGVRHVSVGGLPLGSPQRSEYWTSNLQMARDYAGREGFIRVAHEGDLPPEAIARMDRQRGVTTSLKLGEGGEPANVQQVRTIAELPATAADAKFRVGSAVKMDGFLFREADGWTPADVRALAAKKNMQEGSGDAIDAARMLRERPDLVDGALPVTGPVMKNALALARLSDEAFGMAVNGVVPPGHAAAVGGMVPDPLQHAAVLADLARMAPETERAARLLIGEIMSAGFRTEQQINLFGSSTATRSLMGERVKVLDVGLQQLVKDKKLFGTLAEQADTIEGVGNVLARGANEQRAHDAAALSDLLTRLAQRTGPVSDALSRAAQQVAEGGNARKAADTFLEEVRNLLDRDGLAGLLASPELKPRAIVEPGTAEAATAAEAAMIERQQPTLTAPAERGLFDQVAVAAREDGKDARFISREAALAEADKPALHADLVASCKG